MKTITIQIGNSDNKLTQVEWANYCLLVTQAVRMHSSEMHFYGHPYGDAPWQNAAWVCDVEEPKMYLLADALRAIRQTHHQESVALTIGRTEFI